MNKIINDILEKRRNHISAINAQIDTLNFTLKNLEDYSNLRNSIIDSEGNLKGDSKFPYLIKYPNVVASIYDADPNILYPVIKEHIIRLENLKKRFSRKSLTIQIFGGAGSGKSTFIQSITNLDNNVVMAAEGDHCTGTTSYIRNIEENRFEARIYPYTRYEILNIFNDALKEALKEKHLKEVSISSFDDIENFNLQEVGLDVKDYAVSHYITNYSIIKSVLNQLDEEGLLDEENNRKYIRIEKPDNVQQFVAHHNDYECNDSRYKTYQKYLAVKFVRIFTKFKHDKAGQIELLDSVGFGDKATKSLVEKSMYQSIAENCDIVAIICSPFKRSDVDTASEIMDKAHFEGDLPDRTERISEKCLFLILNNDKRPSRNNTEYCNYSKSVWTNGKNPKADSPFHRTETVLCADLHDSQETEDNVLIPILQQVTQNLPYIDESIKKNVNEKTIELQKVYNSFVQKISNVLIVRPNKGGGHGGFDKRFRELYEVELRKELESIVESAKSGINKPAASLARALKVKCNDNSISNCIKEIEPDIKQINPASTPADWLVAYEKIASKLAHLIPTMFKDIDIDLNENMAKRKASVFDSLYDTGRLNVLIKKKDDSSKPGYINTLEWASKLNETIITETEYPILHNIIHELLTFNISIDGLLLFRIIKHFDELLDGDKAPDPNRLKKDGYDAIRFYLKRNLEKSFDKIKPELENFTVAPNEAIYYALDTFSYNFLHHPDIELECRSLYEQFEKQVWKRELEEIGDQEFAFDEWRDMRNKLSQTTINTL